MSKSETLVQVSELAADQWGLFTAAQAKRRGATANDLSRLSAAQVIRPVRHGVYAMAGAPASSLETVRAEWLATDPELTVSERAQSENQVVVSDETAASIHGFGDFTTDRLTFNSQRRLQTSQPAVSISRRAMSDREWSLVDGLPVTTPRRTLEDLAANGHWDPDHITTAIGDAVRSNKLPRHEISRSKALLQAAPQLAEPASNASVLARLNDNARRRKVSAQNAQGDFFRFMFIHHLMEHNPDWVLKGGTAMLCRFRDTRATGDLDLFQRRGDNAAVSAQRLVQAMNGARVGDYTFVCSEPRTGPNEDTDVSRADVTVLGGGREVGSFHVDVSAGVVLNRDPDIMQAERPDTAILPGYPSRITVRLYPVENQIADKVCAMYSTYSGGPSTRYRDLYDLAVLADQSDPDAVILAEALTTQQKLRRMSLPSRMGPPTSEWPEQYNRAARRMAGAKDPYRDFRTAIAKVAAVINPALDQVSRHGTTRPLAGELHPQPRDKTTDASPDSFVPRDLEEGDRHLLD